MTPTAPHPNLRRIGGEALLHVLSSLLSFPATEETPAQDTADAEDESLILATVALIEEHGSGEVRLQISDAFARLALGVEIDEALLVSRAVFAAEPRREEHLVIDR